MADCVIAHNMWPASLDNVNTYIENGLDELVPPRFKKISFQKNPLLFILALADTIDPVKMYLSTTELCEQDIWKGIDISFEQDYINMKILDSRLSFSKLCRKITGLDNWLDVDITTNAGKKELTILFGKGDN